jgi:hypothetical protein
MLREPLGPFCDFGERCRSRVGDECCLGRGCCDTLVERAYKVRDIRLSILLRHGSYLTVGIERPCARLV